MASKKKVAFGASAGVAALVSVMLSGIYQREGLYVDHKADRGGPTMRGVTQDVARKAGYKGDMRVFPQSCETEQDVCADKIYYETYILKPGIVPILQLSPPVADEMFDTGVNMGPYYGGLFLQKSLNDVCTISPKLTVDGRVGPGTQTRFKVCQANIGKVTFCKKMVTAMDGYQKDRYDAIVRNNPSQKVFYKGWINHRIGNVPLKRCEV